MDDIAIKVAGVSKNFLLPHEKQSTLKSSFLTRLRGGNRSLEVQHALRDIDFEVKKGEFFGIVGRNGSGKSTLLKILAGIYAPSKGEVAVNGKLVPFIELGVGFNGELTGRENVYLNGAMLGFSKTQIDAMYNDIVEFSELENFMDQKLKNYSSGMQVRLAFSVATRAEADILLVDEVLAVGDASFQRKCFDYFRTLKKLQKTVVFVSHDMTAVREYCDRAILIEKSEIKARGTASKIATEYGKLFAGTNDSKAAKGENRWGDGSVRITATRVEQAGSGKDATVKIEMKAKAKVTVENPVVGFTVRNALGTAVIGTNSKIKIKTIKSLKKGESITVRWKFPNILNDGTYVVDPAIVHQDTIKVYDWWEEAARFTVTREERTPYVASPYIDLEIGK